MTLSPAPISGSLDDGNAKIVDGNHCRQLIFSLDLTRVEDSAEQYRIRGIYKDIVQYVMNAVPGELSTHHLYDVWASLSEARYRAPRGFFLDLWDLYRDERKQPTVNARPGEDDEKLLRSYVALMWPKFTQILELDGVAGETVWQARAEVLLRGLANGEVGAPLSQQRLLLYSLVHLYHSLFPDPTDDKGKKVLSDQLDAVEAAEACKDMRLLRPQQAFSSGTIAEHRSDSSVDAEDRRLFVQLFTYLYARMDHFGKTDFENFVSRVAGDFGDPANKRPVLSRLLKHWAATAPFFKEILREKVGYAFHEYRIPTVPHLPSYHGCDNVIAVVGAPGVGKTHFLFASEAASIREVKVRTLNVHHVDDSDDADPALRDKCRKDLTRLQELWRKSPNLNKAERQEFKTKGGEEAVYAQTDIRGMCRFTFFDIAGEHLAKPGHAAGPSDWLKRHFRTFRPCAILLVFEPKTEGTKLYDPVVDLVEEFVARGDSSYLSIPIYLVMNKSDELLAATGADADERLRGELGTFFNSGEVIRSGFRFPSLRDEAGIDNAEAVVRRLEDTESCCRSLAFLSHLRQDVRRVARTLEKCFSLGFCNVSLVYTTCLQQKTRVEDGSEFGSLTALWQDLSSYIGRSTVDSRKAYLREELIDRVDMDFRSVARFVEEASVDRDLSFRNQDLNRYVLSGDAQLQNDFRAVADAANGTDGDPIEKLPAQSGYMQIAKYVKEFHEGKEEVASQLTRAVIAILEELGVPPNTRVAELRGYRDLEPVIRGAIPLDASSSAVRRFEKSKEYDSASSEMRGKLLGLVQSFNLTSPADPLQVNQTGVDSVVHRLPELLRGVDAANRREIAFDRRRGALNTLCPFKDRPPTPTEESIMIQWGGGVTVLDVVKRLMENRPDTTPQASVSETEVSVAQLIPEGEEAVQTLCGLLKNFSPRYSQFVFELFDRDAFKAQVLKRLRTERMALEDQLLQALRMLLKVWQDLRATDLDPEAISRTFQARSLLKVLEAWQFNVGAFIADPAGMSSKIGEALVVLDGLMEQDLIYGNNLLEIDREIQQLPRASSPPFRAKSVTEGRAAYETRKLEYEREQNKTAEEIGTRKASLEAKRREVKQTQLDNRQQALTKLDTLMAVVKSRHSVLQATSLEAEAPVVLRELRAANALSGKVRQLMVTDDRIRDLPTLHSREFALGEIVRYNQKLGEYWQDRRLLLVRERAEYLQETGWVAGLSVDSTQFLTRALKPKEEYLQGVNKLDDVTLDVIKKDFQEGVRKICEDEAIWSADFPQSLFPTAASGTSPVATGAPA